MTPEIKNNFIRQLRDDFVEFIDKIKEMPGSQLQKQQAFLRLDEGHMWMQNAIASYKEPITQQNTQLPNQQIIQQ